MILGNYNLEQVDHEELRVNYHSAHGSLQKTKPVIWVGALVFLLTTAGTAFAGFIQLDGVANVKTRFSRGCSTMQEVTELARARSIDVVVFGDQARDALEYGLVPFEHIFKIRNENSSVLTVGAPAYVSEVNDNDKQFEETLLIPGTEVAPFYYWTGNVFKGDLVANNLDKHLFVVGFEAPEVYEQLPILDSNFSQRYLKRHQYFFGGCVALFLLSLIPVVKGYKRKITGVVAGIMFLLVVSNQPLRSSPFSQYGGDLGAQPYQELIDYVNENGGLVFWNHMEADDGARQEGRVGYNTMPHPEDLVLTSGYTGFQSVADFPIMQIEPGNEWDHVLDEYLQGQREKPAWGYGGNNYLCEDGEIKLGDIRTVFLVREKSRDDVLDALASGRMYAVRQKGDERLSLDDFTVTDVKSGQMAAMGEELTSSDFPELKARIRFTKGTAQTVRLSIIRNGVEVKQETAALPYELTWRDVDVNREEGPVFYRLKVEADEANYLVSNPIFVRFGEGMPDQVVSLPQSTTKKLSMVEPVKPKVQSPQRPDAPSAKPPGKPDQDKVARPLASPSKPESRIQPPSLSPAAVKQPTAPAVKMPSVPAIAGQQSVVAKINGVSLKTGPSPKFPEVGKLKKGDRLPLIRSTTVEFNGKPWLAVDAGGRKAYVWSGLVTTE